MNSTEQITNTRVYVSNTYRWARDISGFWFWCFVRHVLIDIVRLRSTKHVIYTSGNPVQPVRIHATCFMYSVASHAFEVTVFDFAFFVTHYVFKCLSAHSFYKQLDVFQFYWTLYLRSYQMNRHNFVHKDHFAAIYFQVESKPVVINVNTWN